MSELENSPLGDPEVIFRLEVASNVTEIYYGFKRQELVHYHASHAANNTSECSLAALNT